MKKIQAILIDDERLARQELKILLGDYTELEIVGEARNSNEGVEQIHRLRPDLIFLDISMPPTDGFSMLEQLDHVPYVIFVTAYDQYALKAFEVNALDYIVKPMKPERLAVAMERAVKRLDELEQLNGSLKEGFTRRLFVKDGDKCSFVRISEIFMVESVGNYARLYLHKSRMLVHQSLNMLHNRLGEETFFRANRQNLVNLEAIVKVHPISSTQLEIELSNGQRVVTSVRQSFRFKKLFEI